MPRERLRDQPSAEQRVAKPRSIPLRVAGDGRERIVIEDVKPEIDSGRFPIKRTVGEKVVVEADVFADGHDALACVLLHRWERADAWTESRMELLANDRWRGEFTVTQLGRYLYTLQAWTDPFKTWQRDLTKKAEAGTAAAIDLRVGASLIEQGVRRARGADAERLRTFATLLRRNDRPVDETLETAIDAELAELMERYPDKGLATRYQKELIVTVDRERARFSTWYEMFPRSCAGEAGRHGTFADCEARLGYVASMGFDVLYLPPIHPIGRTHRKGRNNSPAAGPDDPGSPWAIGSEEGGHKAIHPALGTLADFRRLLGKAREHGLEVALDLAYHCSPDHPYVKEHPEWFRWRPDGTLQYAENPPKKYEDIYPFDFETDRWQALWEELKSIVDYWIEQGVRIFRVDNPHTKSLRFWEWLIDDVKKRHPEVIFLSEAFTRPKVMQRLAKIGFTQSYTYFTWRTTKRELTEYFTELAHTEMRDYFRPNLWPNTPDILPDHLQSGGRPAFLARLVLAATLAANYGVYGPAFELLESRAREPGTEEYLNSEKYELRHWPGDRPESLRDFIALVNRIRKQNPALQSVSNLRFHPVDNDQLICYSKQTGDLSNAILVVVNLDFHHRQSGWLELAGEELGIAGGQPYQVHDLLSEGRYLWHGGRNYVELDPHVSPAHIFRVRHRVRREQDFDYYM